MSEALHRLAHLLGWNRAHVDTLRVDVPVRMAAWLRLDAAGWHFFRVVRCRDCTRMRIIEDACSDGEHAVLGTDSVPHTTKGDGR